MECRIRKVKRLFWIINVLAPLLMGALLYYVFSPDVIFVRCIDSFLGRKGIHINYIDYIDYSGTVILRFVRNYLLDMIWAYTLVFAMSFILCNNAAEIMKMMIIIVCFTVVMEMLQCTNLVNGTFDILDIVVELLAEFIAVFIIKKYFFMED